MNEFTKSELEDEFRRLEDELSIVAAGFRGCLGDRDCKEEMIEKYHAIFKRMYDLGWRDRLYNEDTLPWNMMPVKYREMYPEPGQTQFYSESDYYTPREIDYESLPKLAWFEKAWFVVKHLFR